MKVHKQLQSLDNRQLNKSNSKNSRNFKKGKRIFTPSDHSARGGKFATLPASIRRSTERLAIKQEPKLKAAPNVQKFNFSPTIDKKSRAIAQSSEMRKGKVEIYETL